MYFKPKTGVCIHFLGEAKVNIDEWETEIGFDGKSHSRNVEYRGREEYVNNTIVVHGEGVLPPGTYDYSFNFTLPENCPTSCEGKYGMIRYELSLKIDRPFCFDNEFYKPLTVLRMIDPNLNPAYRVRRIIMSQIVCC